MLKLLFGDERKGSEPSIKSESDSKSDSKSEVNDVDPGSYSFHIFSLLEENKKISGSNKKLFTKFDWSSVNRLNMEDTKDYLWYHKDNHLLLAVPTEGKKPIEYIQDLLNSLYIRIKNDYDGYRKIKMVHNLKVIETYPVDPSEFEIGLKDIADKVNKIEEVNKNLFGKKFGFHIFKYMKELEDDKLKQIDEDDDKASRRIKKNIIEEMKKTLINQISEIREEQKNKFKKEAEFHLNDLANKKNLNKLKNIKFGVDTNNNQYRMNSKIVIIKLDMDKSNESFFSINDKNEMKTNVKKWKGNDIFLTNKELKQKKKENNETNECSSKIKNVVEILDIRNDDVKKNKHEDENRDGKISAMEAHISNFISEELMEFWNKFKR